MFRTIQASVLQYGSTITACVRDLGSALAAVKLAKLIGVCEDARPAAGLVENSGRSAIVRFTKLTLRRTKLILDWLRRRLPFLGRDRHVQRRQVFWYVHWSSGSKRWALASAAWFALFHWHGHDRCSSAIVGPSLQHALATRPFDLSEYFVVEVSSTLVNAKRRAINRVCHGPDDAFASSDALSLRFWTLPTSRSLPSTGYSARIRSATETAIGWRELLAMYRMGLVPHSLILPPQSSSCRTWISLRL